MRFVGAIVNNLACAIEKVRCNPPFINMPSIPARTSYQFFAYGISRVIGSCSFFILNETVELLWNIQTEWNSEFYGITNTDTFNTTVLIPSHAHAAYFLNWTF